MRKLKFVSKLRAKNHFYWLIKQEHENLVIHLENLEKHLGHTKVIQKDIAYYNQP